MSLHNTSLSYGPVARGLHWATAVLIVLMIPLGFAAETLADSANAPGATPSDAAIARVIFLFSLHKTLGVLVFFLALSRLIWMILQTKPAPLHPDRRTETFLAETVHFALYGALVLVPLSGWLHHAAATGFAPIWWPFGQSLPFVPKDAALSHVFSALHGLSVWVLIGALALHIAGALKHHLIDKDTTLSRMTRGTSGGIAHTNAPTLPLVAAIALWALVPVGAFSAGLFATGTDKTPELAQVVSDWQVHDGTLGIAITQMGNRVEGTFSDWTAQISFADDPSTEKNGSVDVTISIPSLTLGSVTDQAMGPDYFDASTHPTARFTADILRSADGFIAKGTLTIKDHSLPLTLPFTLVQDGQTATAEGQTQTDRRDYGMGQSVTAEGTLGFTVDILFKLTATR